MSVLDSLETAFATDFHGEVVTASSPSYDARRAVWNGSIDLHPRVIARCADADDIVAAVRLCREAGVFPAVRAGGHSVAGLSTSDGVVIDLGAMRDVTVDPDRRLARVQAGATWREFDAAGAPHGLATTGGLISSTGVAGLTLGGGIGWLQRRYGLSCDNLVGATLVTAAGELVSCSEDVEPELLWGLRGGGGNFGVVTELTFRMHEVGTVLGGMAMFSLARGREVLTAFAEWARTAPDEASVLAGVVTAPPEPFVPAQDQGRPALVIAGCWCGDLAEGEAALAPLRALGPFVDLFGPMPYPVLQSLQDPGAPAGNRNHFRGGYLADLGDDVIEVLLDHGSRMPSPLSQIHLHQMGGAVARIADEATSFGPRSAGFAYNLISTWLDPAEDDTQVAANRALAGDLAPLSLGTGYVNFLTDRGPEAARQAYGDPTYARLAQLKTRWDPDNLFRQNHNVAPA